MFYNFIGTTDHDQRGVTRPQGKGCDIGPYRNRAGKPR
jgi:hypothetical protein